MVSILQLRQSPVPHLIRDIVNVGMKRLVSTRTFFMLAINNVVSRFTTQMIEHQKFYQFSSVAIVMPTTNYKGLIWSTPIHLITTLQPGMVMLALGCQVQLEAGMEWETMA